MSDKKHYVMGNSIAEVDRKVPATPEELKAVIKGDGYDEMRVKALTSSDYPTQRERAFAEVERQISILVENKEKPLPVTSIRPYEDRVVIWPDKPLTVTNAGIYIPEAAQEKELPDTGTVMACGPGRIINGIFNKVDLKYGDRVLYGKYAGTIVKDKKSGESFLIIRYGDVFASE